MSNKKHIYKFSILVSVVESRTITGLFIASEEEVKAAIGQTIYFGELMSAMCRLRPEHLRQLSIECDDNESDFIDAIENLIGGRTLGGYNPLEYIVK